MRFWMDKILDDEMHKPIPTTPPKPRVLIEKTVSDKGK
jgi:hypothetical protein